MRYVTCECHTTYHFLCIETEEGFENDLNVSFCSTKNASFWHRVKFAMKHVFGSQDLVAADIIIKRDELVKALEAR